MSGSKWGVRVPGVEMVCLPRIIGSRSVLADVADDCGVTHDLGLLAVVGVIEGFLMLCPANIFHLLQLACVRFAACAVGQCAAVKAWLTKFHLN